MRDNLLSSQKLAEPKRPAHVQKRRRLNLYRTLTIVITTSAALILFVSWWRAYPRRSECYNAAVVLLKTLDAYRLENQRLPPILDVLPLERKRRYILGHFEYQFPGLGAPATLPDGTIVANCNRVHTMVFHEPWRCAVMFREGKLVVEFLPEKIFENLLEQRKTLLPLY